MGAFRAQHPTRTTYLYRMQIDMCVHRPTVGWQGGEGVCAHMPDVGDWHSSVQSTAQNPGQL